MLRGCEEVGRRFIIDMEKERKQGGAKKKKEAHTHRLKIDRDRETLKDGERNLERWTGSLSNVY